MIGAGYVGLVSAVCFSEFGWTVNCVDKDPEKIAALKTLGIECIAGAAAENDASRYDFGVLSPGIDPVVPHQCRTSSRLLTNRPDSARVIRRG